jgi:hypothetical protein
MPEYMPPDDVSIIDFDDEKNEDGEIESVHVRLQCDWYRRHFVGEVDIDPMKEDATKEMILEEMREHFDFLTEDDFDNGMLNADTDTLVFKRCTADNATLTGIDYVSYVYLFNCGGTNCNFKFYMDEENIIVSPFEDEGDCEVRRWPLEGYSIREVPLFVHAAAEHAYEGSRDPHCLIVTRNLGYA